MTFAPMRPATDWLPKAAADPTTPTRVAAVAELVSSMPKQANSEITAAAIARRRSISTVIEFILVLP
jgi:hypothetical protein